MTCFRKENSPLIQSIHKLQYTVQFEKRLILQQILGYIQTYPEETKLKSRKNDLPIHILLRYRDISHTFWDEYYAIILFLLQVHPESTKITDKDKYYPLHSALVHKLPTCLIITLLHAYPEVLKKTCDWKENIGKSLPFMIAISTKRSFDLLQTLYSSYPEVVNSIVPYYGYPLHEALDYRSDRNFEIIKLLADANPRAAQEERHPGGELPLHLACQHCSQEVILYIFRLHPAGLFWPNDSGLYPFCFLPPDYTNVFKEMVQLCPDAFTRNYEYIENGFFIQILYTAMGWRVDSMKPSWYKSFKVLVDVYPEAVNQINENAIQYSIRNRRQQLLRYIWYLNYHGLQKQSLIFYRDQNWLARRNMIMILVHLIEKRPASSERNLWVRKHIDRKFVNVIIKLTTQEDKWSMRISAGPLQHLLSYL